jgi:hypothetical protein
VFAIGQLRALSQKPGHNPSSTATPSGGTPTAATYSRQQQQQQQPPGSAADMTASPFEQQPYQQQQQQFPRSTSNGLLSAKTSAEQAAAAAAAAAAVAQQASRVVPLQDHPNVAVAGHPAGGPLGVLQLTVQVRFQGTKARDAPKRYTLNLYRGYWVECWWLWKRSRHAWFFLYREFTSPLPILPNVYL